MCMRGARVGSGPLPLRCWGVTALTHAHVPARPHVCRRRVQGHTGANTFQVALIQGATRAYVCMFYETLQVRPCARVQGATLGACKSL